MSTEERLQRLEDLVWNEKRLRVEAVWNAAMALQKDDRETLVQMLRKANATA